MESLQKTLSIDLLTGDVTFFKNMITIFFDNINFIFVRLQAGIYRESLDDIPLPKIPVQPISRRDAETLLR